MMNQIHEQNYIDLRQLQAFKALAETGSFTMAARRIFLTQSAVSHSIRALESDLECSLFTRVGKKVHLTQAGEQLLEKSSAVFQALIDARQAVRNIVSWGKGRLRIGASIMVFSFIRSIAFSDWIE